MEVCFSNVWGTVCDNGWSTADATVVCGQLGYSRAGETDTIICGQVHYMLCICLVVSSTYYVPTVSTDAVAFSNAHFGAGTGSVFVTSVGCSGTETSLLGCSYSTSSSGCSHSDDAGIRCQCMSKTACLKWRQVWIMFAFFPSHSVA